MSASGLIIIGSMMLAAEFIFGMAMVSKASRSEKANNEEKENDAGKKVIATTSAVMLTTLLAFGVAVACVGGKSDKTEDSAPGAVSGTTTKAITTTAEETTEAEEAETTATITTETTPETTIMPLSEFVKYGSKGCIGEFDTVFTSHNEIIIDGIAADGPTIKTGESDLYVPAEVNGYRIRAIDVRGFANPEVYNYYLSNGISTVYVLPEMQFIITTWDTDTMQDNITEISFDEAASYFSQCGMSLQKYDADKVKVEKELLPLNEVVILFEEDYSNFRYIFLNDNSIIVDGITDSEREFFKRTDEKSTRIYEMGLGWKTRAINVNGDWSGLETIKVPSDISFVERKGSEFVEVPFEKAKEIFAEKGISIETY